MISIAVFLGFWAESFRNQISDNKKVMQIKKAIGKDLKKDLKQLDEYTNQAKFNLLMTKVSEQIILPFCNEI
jgi:aminopeptidase N